MRWFTAQRIALATRCVHGHFAGAIGAQRSVTRCRFSQARGFLAAIEHNSVPQRRQLALPD